MMHGPTNIKSVYFGNTQPVSLENVCIRD